MRQTPCGPRGAAFLSAPRRQALGRHPVKLIALAPILLLLLLAPRLAHAVGELGGSIGGYVTIKGTKDGISSVPVTIRSKVLIGGPQQAATSDDGSYAFQNLPPGKYELEVRMEGFAPVRMVNILVNSGARSSVDVELEVVTSTQHNETTRIIEKTNPILNAESAAATTPISNAQITRAPTFRQEKGVAQYTAGVSQGTDRAQVRGGLGRFNRYYIDGLEVTDITTGAFGTSSALINSDSVEQFAVSVGAMDAEYNSLGLVQNMVTRSGGNKLIVDASIIFQPPFVSDTTRYPARQPLYNGALQYDDRPLPDRSFYSAAINIGGPIIKDKLWFWTNFQFNFNRLTFNIAEQSWYPGLQKAYDRYQDQVLYLGRVKLTWQASKSTRVTLSYSTDFNDIVNASAYSYGSIDASTLAPEAERRWQRGGHWVGVLIDSLLTDKLLLQLQTGVFYKHFLDETQLLRSGQPDRITASHQLQTADAATNNFVYLNGTRPWDDQTKWSAQFAPTLMYTARGLGGTHNIKGGLQFTYMNYSHNTGVAGGQRFIDTVPGLPCDAENPATFSSCRQVEVFPDSLPAGGQAGAGYTTTAQAINLGLFLQDRFVFKRWLTIVPGIRVDTGMLYNTEGVRMQTLVGFGPRLSLIYDLFHDRTTLIKAHYGRHNDMGNAGIADVGNPTMSSIIKRWNPATSSFEEFRRTGGAGSQTFAAEVNLTPPKVDEVSVGVHREVTEQTVVGVDYTYRAYGNFWVNEETNQIWDPAGLRVVGTANGQSQRLYSATTPDDARRDYHGVDFWVRGNPGRWDMTASYTLAFLNGNVNEFFESAAYRYNPRLSPLFYGPIAGAPRHYLKGLLNYAFEFGLTIGARLQYFSGTPQWKQFQSPEDASYTLYRSPRGSSTGSRNNDPTTWADFRLPDTFNLDLQIAYSLEKLTGQRIDIIAMLFNLLNLSPATAIETRDGATFGVVTRRPDNLFCEFVVRYRY